MRCKACNALMEDTDKQDLCHPCNVESLKARFPDQRVQDNDVQELYNKLKEVRRLTEGR